MASECYLGTIPLLPDSTTLPLPSARCTPEGGICYTTLSHGGGQATAQLGCWPSQSSMQLAWLGVPECKNEVGRLMCLCLETLCNKFLPSASEITPEGGDLQGGVMVLLVLLLGFMLTVVFYCLYKHMKHDKSDVENRDDVSYMQEEDKSPYQIAPTHHYNYPTTPPNSQGSPAPLLRMASAPARLKSPSWSGDQVQLSSDFGREATRKTEVNRNKSRPSPVLMEGPFIQYLDMSKCQSFIKPPSIVKRLDLGGGLVGRHNAAFVNPKEGQEVKSPGKVTAV